MPSASSTSPRTTLAPSLTKSRPSTAPIPLAPPLINATLPASLTTNLLGSDDARGAQPLLLGVRVAELGQDLGGVLAEERRRAVHRTGRVRELDGNAERLGGPRA